jgi:hypothetical protein
MSFLCASLIVSLGRVQESGVSLHFFCGMHTSRDDSLTGPNGMIRSLVSQILMELIRRRILDLEFVSTRSFRDAIERHDLKTLCLTFCLLVAQLPLETPVYCIVDGITWYEDSEYQTQLEYVADQLRWLVAAEKLGPRFKVLITSSYESRCISQRIPSKQRVFLRSEFGDGDVMSERLMVYETQQLRVQKPSSSRVRRPGDSSDDEDAPEDYM